MAHVCHHFSSVFGCLYIFVGFTDLIGTVRKGYGKENLSFSQHWDILSGDLPEVTSRIEPIDLFPAAPVVLT